MKILIVEDDKILSDTIKQCLKNEYEIEQAFDEKKVFCMQCKIYMM